MILYSSLGDFLSTVKHRNAKKKIKELKSVHDGIRPFYDYVNNDGYFVSDGHGCKYPSMRFRKISLGGEEIAVYPIYNVVRCFYYDPNGSFILLVLDGKFIILNTLTLVPTKVITKRIPKYANQCIIYKNKIYAATMDNILYCHDIETGELEKITLPQTKSLKEIFPHGFPHNGKDISLKVANPKLNLQHSVLVIKTNDPSLVLEYDLERQEFIKIQKLNLLHKFLNVFASR